MKRAWRALWEILLPPICPLCLEATPEDDERLCPTCLSQLIALKKPHGNTCALPFDSTETQNSAGHRCSQCMRSKPPFTRIIVFGPFEATLRSLVHRFKYSGDVTLRATLEELFIKGVEAGLDRVYGFGSLPHFDAVVPVPCHRSTLHKRGFDLPALLSRKVAKRWKTKWKPKALIKTRRSEKMAGLGLKHRKEAVRKLYRASGPITGTICLVDDVVTSTATVRACARELKQAGADEVWVMALARTPIEPMR